MRIVWMICCPSILFFSYLINRIQLFEKECVKRGKDKRTYIISEGW